jgi:hypothetical protein
MKDEIEILNALLKASDSEEPEDDERAEEGKDEYDESYMKKYLKRYMKENKDEAKKYAEDLGLMAKAFVKAADEIEGIDEADATLVEGTQFIKALIDMGNGLVEKMGELNERIAGIEGRMEYNEDLIKASGGVLVKAMDTLDAIGKEPMPRRSETFDPQQLPERGMPLVKAKGMNYKEIKRMVLKASMEGNENATSIITQLDLCGGNLSRLSPSILASIDALIV